MKWKYVWDNLFLILVVNEFFLMFSMFRDIGYSISAYSINTEENVIRICTCNLGKIYSLPVPVSPYSNPASELLLKIYASSIKMFVQKINSFARLLCNKLIKVQKLERYISLNRLNVGLKFQFPPDVYSHNWLKF